MEVYSAVSGQMLAVVAPTDLEGKSGRMVKQILSDQLGISRFRQRLFCEGGFLEIPDAMIFEAVPLKVELVVLNFCPPEPRDTQRIIAASRANASASLEKLLQRPMDPNLVDQHGLTALHNAAKYGNLQMVKLLLEAGAKKDAPDTGVQGRTPLHCAAENGHLDVVRLLVEAGANMDQPMTEGGSTPLHWAAENGHLDVARLLVEAGANKDQPMTEDGSTPLHLAAQNNHDAVVRLLNECGANSIYPWKTQLLHWIWHQSRALWNRLF